MPPTIEAPLTASTLKPVRRSCTPLISTIAALILGAGIATAILTDSRPNAASASSPPAEFSAERARAYVDRIGRSSHPIGSSEHDSVRDYIISELAKNGLTAQVQRTISVNAQRGLAARVQNILARVYGKSHDDAVLLVAHYDSVPTGEGAADDGAGVAALLETARALQHGPELNRDVVFLFSDGEEEGLFGARAFVAQHPWAKNIGVVLNFEARGTGGPVVMFETSTPNSSLVREFGAAAKQPVASSLTYEIYKRLPNDTDFTVFRRAGFAGLNFAFIRHFAFYHTELDNPRDLALGSLQQEGENMLALARRFADAPPRSGGGNAVYFDVLGIILVDYSIATAYMLLAATVGLLLAVLWAGLRRPQMFSAKGLIGGSAGLLLALVAGLAVTWFASWLTSYVGSGSDAVRSGLLYHSGLYVAAFAAAGLAVALLAFRWVTRTAGLYNLSAACLIVWALLAAATSFAIPGASYVFLWPLLFMLAGWAAAVFRRGPNSIVLPIVASLPAILLWVPLMRSVLDAFAQGSALLIVALLILLAGLLAVALDAIFDLARMRFSAGAAAAALVFFFGALAVSHVDRDHPSRFSLLWAMDADTGEQVWTSLDITARGWTSSFFSNPPHRDALTEFFPDNSRKLPTAPAEASPVPAPTAAILEDSHGGGVRKLRVAVKSARQAPILYISFDPKTAVSEVSVDGARIDPEHGEIVFYGAPKEGIELDFEARDDAKIRLDVKDVSYGLPGEALKKHPRPSDAIPAPTFLNDSMLVKKSFLL
jgi:TPR repeat protein